MTPDDEAEIGDAMRAAIHRARGYADFFGWATNRDLEEQGVVTSLSESIEADNSLFFPQFPSVGGEMIPQILKPSTLARIESPLK